MSQKWYLVLTKPRKEEIARENLVRQGFECYLPRIQVERIRRNKKVQVEEALFPRYLFVRLQDDRQGRSWIPIRSTIGVTQLVKFGQQPAEVDDELVQLLRQREGQLPTETLFHPGDVVTVTDGPFAGIEAIYQMEDAEQRAIILLELISKPVRVPIEPGLLRKSS